jgi:mitochondrial fission protein ELM1
MRDQVLGLAEALARLRPVRIVSKTLAWRCGIGRAPTWLNIAPRLALDPASAIAPPWPDIWIAAGRATLPLSLRLRSWSGGRTFVVQAQDPRVPPRRFDLVVPPAHDGLAGPEVFPIAGAPHRVTPERIAADRDRFAALIDPLPRPRVAVLIGGKSKAFRLSAARASEMADEIRRSLQGGSIMLTFSRRTPAPARAALAAGLRDVPGVIWDETGENPFFAFLGGADAVLVTEDSTGMAVQAAATGKPVLILSMEGESAKFGRFHADLRARGVARPFAGALETWTYPPLAETERAAAEILRRYDAREARP